MLRRWFISLVLVAGMLGSAVTAYAATGNSSRFIGDGQTAGSDRGLAAGAATVKVVTNAAAGTILTDGAGRTLYLWFSDERNKSNRIGTTSPTWPPLMTDGTPQAGAGVTQARLGTITWPDGQTQVSYNGWPLYYFARDEKLSDVNGQGIGNVWWVVSPFGGPRQTLATLKVTPGAVGPMVTDSSGRSLYAFGLDTFNRSNCAGTCPQAWPPLLTIGPAKSDAGVDPNLISHIQREDGSTQVTYRGWPLHYYSLDEKPGDLKGQNLFNVWNAVSPAGIGIRGSVPAAPAAPVTPAALPRTGEGFSSGLLGLTAALGALLITGGVWVRRRVVA